MLLLLQRIPMRTPIVARSKLALLSCFSSLWEAGERYRYHASRRHKIPGKKFWVSVMTYAADGGAQSQITGGTPFRQLCPAYPSFAGRQRRICFSEDVPEFSGNPLLKLAPAASAPTHKKATPYRQANPDSRNLSNIATLLHSVNKCRKHPNENSYRARPGRQIRTTLN